MSRDVYDELNKKLTAEQTEYESGLLAEGAGVVLDNAFNIAMRKEILHVCMDWTEDVLSEEAVSRLLDIPGLLGLIYDEWLHVDGDLWGEIAPIIKSLAGEADYD